MNLSPVTSASDPSVYALARTYFAIADTTLASLHARTAPSNLELAAAADQLNIGIRMLEAFAVEPAFPQPVRVAVAQARDAARTLPTKLVELLHEPTGSDPATKLQRLTEVDAELHGVLHLLRER